MTTEQPPDPIRLLRELVAAFNRYDLDTAMSFFVEDCIYQTPRGRRPWGRKITGKQEVRLAFERQFGRFEDARMVDDHHWVCGDRGVSEWTIVGTLRTGEPAELWGCDLWTFRGGKIAVRNSFWKIPLGDGTAAETRTAHS